MNQFVQRVANYLANEVIIKGLANSRTFQRFAVRSEVKMQELHKTGTESFAKAFEELNKMQARGTATVAASSVQNSGPPVPPRRGVGGFIEAFLKEIRSDLGIK